MVTGDDRAAYLQGLLTNDIEALGRGEGCYAAYLTPQGRMLADMTVLCLEDGILLDVDASVTSLLRERFEEFIFTEDVAVDDRSDSWTSVGVHGPTAAALLATVFDLEQGAFDALAEHATLPARLGGVEVVVAGSRALGVAGFTVYAGTASGSALLERLRQEGAARLSADEAEALRIEAGRPAFPADLGSDVIPLEAGIEDRAISMTKGCYVGQEVIVRILHRGGGRVARQLVGLVFDGDEGTVEAGTELVADVSEPGDDAVGAVTSAARSPGSGSVIGLGYVKRELGEAGTRLRTAGDGGRVARVASLPLTGPVGSPASG